MPNIWRDKTHHFVAYVTGPAHVLLGLAVSPDPVHEVAMMRRAAVGHCGCGPVDALKVKEAVLAGIAEANEVLSSNWHAAEIIFVDDDSPRYEIYQHCARLLIEHISSEQA